jgi:hypothetical protein
MKRRQGFVSNSSSSSFIIAVDKEVKNEDLKVEVSIAKCVDARIETVEELQAYYEREYIWRGDDEKDLSFIMALQNEGDWLVERYETAEQAIYNGKVIIMGSGSNEGDSAGELAVYYGALNSLSMPGVDVIQSGD